MFEDDFILVEPTKAEVTTTLWISPKGRREFYDLILIEAGPAG